VTIRGSVDAVTIKSATGWAYAQGRHDDILVQAVLSHEVIGDAVATDHRPDLAAVGMGKGNCGYTIEFYREIDPLYLPFISIKVDGGDIELPRAGQLGFADFLTAFHRAHPAAGRPRSALGGLWTDRTDATAILKSKMDIGQVTPEAGLVVGQLVTQGIAIIEQEAAAPGEDMARNGTLSADRIAALVEDPLTLDVLRAIFDDHPLVLAAETILGRDTLLAQPSAESGSPSPAECLVVAAPTAGAPITVEIVRDSHQLPEFTPAGILRWARNEVHAGVELAAAQRGLMMRYEVSPGAVAIVGPGTIYRLRCGGGADGLRLHCTPARTMAMTLASDPNRRETMRESRVRIYL
jgi:hypothetical protein